MFLTWLTSKQYTVTLDFLSKLCKQIILCQFSPGTSRLFTNYLTNFSGIAASQTGNISSSVAAGNQETILLTIPALCEIAGLCNKFFINWAGGLDGRILTKAVSTDLT